MKKSMKKIVATVLLVMFIVSMFPVSAFAASSKTVNASFYLLNSGLPVPVGTASQPKSNYSAAGSGKITVTDGYTGEYNEEGVSNIVSAPEVSLESGQSVVWYVTKQESEGWHVDGVIIPFYSFLYDGNGATSGSTTDPQHYFKKDTATVKASSFTYEGHEFTGWNTKADGSGKAYKEGDTIVVKDLGFPKGINIFTLYAQWKSTGKEDDKKDDKKDDEDDDSKSIELGIVTPKKMSVRFEDGSVYKTGDTLNLEIGKEYKFQMCSNDWDTDTYTDYGYGIAGTVVYTVKVSNSYTERSYDEATKTFVLPKGDPVLRTDVNKCFMAYRFHFNEDYDKQTGILKVVNTPTESLSVNLPLGSTIITDAYNSFKYVKTAFVFIEQAEDKTISYTDYNWGF